MARRSLRIPGFVLFNILWLCGASASNVAFFYNGELLDASFNQLTNSGLQRLVADRPTVNLTLQYLESNQLLALGAAFPFPAGFESSDAVVCAGFQFASPISGWAVKFPNMKFVLIDVALEPSPPNVNSCIFAEDQLGFLMGSVAGRMTKSGWVGTISGVEIPPVVRYGNGFQQGVYSTCPSCKVILSYVGSFSDGARGQDLAAYQKSLGVDVMISLSGFPGVTGILSVANNTYMIGVDGDLYLSAFKSGQVPGAKNVLFSTAKGVDTAAFVTVSSVLNNAFRSGTSLFQFSNGGLRVLPCHESCALFDPNSDPATLALKDDLTSGAVTTLVTSSGSLAYLFTLPKNEWRLQGVNFAPAASASVSAAHVNDGFSDKVFYLLGSLGQAWLWWPTHRMWTQVATPPPVIGAAVASSSGSSVYVFGGRENLLPTSALWRWDWAESGDSWTQLNVTGPEPEPRGGAVMTYNDDGFYYLFGGSAFEFFNDVWRLNTTTVEWTKLTTTGDAPVGTEFATIVSYRDSLIVYGGGDNQPEILAGIYELNITTSVWRKLPVTLPQRKFHTMVMSANNTAIIVGGIDRLKVRSDSVLAVNLDTYEVSGLPPFPYAVQSHGAAAYGDLVWVFGGSLANGTRLNSTYVYSYSKEELTLRRKSKDKDLPLKLGLGIGLSLLAVIVLLGVLVAVLLKRYHLIVISKENALPPGGRRLSLRRSDF